MNDNNNNKIANDESKLVLTSDGAFILQKQLEDYENRKKEDKKRAEEIAKKRKENL